MTTTRRRPLGAATYTFLYAGTLHDALRSLASAGISLVELTAAPPHVDGCAMAPEDRRRLRRLISRLGLHILTLNPTYLDVNLVSLNTAFRAESVRQLEAALHLAHDLEVRMLVLFSGRRHPLAPAPRSLVEPVLLSELSHLCDIAQRLGVTIGLENGPTLVLDRAGEVAEVCRTLDRPELRAVYDVANAQMVEDPVAGISDLTGYLDLVHLSDTTSAKWAHAPVAEGEVPFAAIAEALDDAGYAGPSIMEIVDLGRPLEALIDSASALSELGWSTVPALRQTAETGDLG